MNLNAKEHKFQIQLARIHHKINELKCPRTLQENLPKSCPQKIDDSIALICGSAC